MSRELERLLSSQEPTETKRKRINSDGPGPKLTERNSFQESSNSKLQEIANQEPDYSGTGWSDRLPDLMTQEDFQPPKMSAIDVCTLLYGFRHEY